jgi:Fe2+ or Zn2+ uptake regulation protein
MKELDFNKTVHILSVKANREILKVIIGNPKTLLQVYKELKSKHAQIKYRESVYKALEKMVSVGLVEKVYNKRIVLYKSKFSKLNIDFINEKIEYYP